MGVYLLWLLLERLDEAISIKLGRLLNAGHVWQGFTWVSSLR